MRLVFSPRAVERRIVRGGENECWRWTGQHHDSGYARIMAHGKPRRYLRISHIMLEEAGHPRPPGMGALHSCDNPWCVNPKHLRWGTQKQNAMDASERGRVNKMRGEAAPAAKLTAGDVRRIRESALSSTAWARTLGVSVSAICRARTRKSWGHVE